jgi:hypothetical protein
VAEKPKHAYGGAYLPEQRHPDFEAGNTMALLSGVHSARAIAERVAEVRQSYFERFPWLSEKDEIKVTTLLQATARHSLLNEFIQNVVAGVQESRRPKGPKVGVEGVPVHLWSELTRLENRLDKAAHDLGLDSTGYAQTVRDNTIAHAIDVRRRMDAFADKGLDLLRSRGFQVGGDE